MIRSGRLSEAAMIANGFSNLKLARKDRLPAANLCRRTGHLSKGLKILWPLVQADTHTLATDSELAEYAALLLRKGAISESLNLLAKINKRKVPEASLFEAFCYFSSWDYPEALKSLRAFLGEPAPEYLRLVGRVNLASALVALENYDEALELIDRLIFDAGQSRSDRLLANCHEIKAQLKIATGDLPSAKTELETASRLLASSSQIDAFFVRKWRAVVRCLESGDERELLEVRDEAQAAGDAESVREADLYRLKTRYQPDLHSFLVFGTPYRFYRARIEKKIEQRLIQHEYLLGNTGGKCLDLATGQIDGQGKGQIKGQSALNVGKRTHQLLCVLTADFYRPMSLGAVHSELFPGEHFNVYSSPGRVHQALRRARKWIHEMDLPMEICEINNSYSLRIVGPLAIRLALSREEVDGQKSHLLRLKRHLATSTFSSREAKAVLGLSSTSFKRFLNWAIESSSIESLDNEVRGTYRLTDRLKKNAA